jgi:hypothetical protein
MGIPDHFGEVTEKQSPKSQSTPRTAAENADSGKRLRLTMSKLETLITRTSGTLRSTGLPRRGASILQTLYQKMTFA